MSSILMIGLGEMSNAPPVPDLRIPIQILAIVLDHSWKSSCSFADDGIELPNAMEFFVRPVSGLSAGD